MQRISRKYFQGLRFNTNVYTVLFFRLAMVMVLFSVCRVVFYFFNRPSFPGMDVRYFLQLMQGGLVFDLSAALYINALYIVLSILPINVRFTSWYQRILKSIFILTNGIALAANAADFIYYKFTLRRTTADVFQQFENETNLTGLWLRFFVDYWYAALVWVMLIAVLFWLYDKWKITGPQQTNTILYYGTGLVAMFFIAGLVVAGLRGGFTGTTRPITLSNAGQYVKDPRDISIVLNTPFAILRSYGKTKMKSVHYFSDAEVDSIYSPIHIPHDSVPFQNQNVVVLILESFSKEFFGTFNADKENGTYKGYTPFLDSLLQHSQTFTYSFANGRKSIDGLPSVISSIPSLGVPYFLSPYSGNTISSLASVLDDKGYHTSFFHGAPNGSMGFQAFMNVAGVDHYFGKDEYNNDDDFDGIWGVWDEKFLNFYADKMNEFPQPFMSSFFSVSSHHPFKVPAEYEGKFKRGTLIMHPCIGYTDYSLKRFFQKISKMPWYKNTIFVITADHVSSEIQFDESRTAAGYYSVPIVFFKPDNSLAGRSEQIAQQIDIMPSVLGYLHYDKPYFAFGRDEVREDATPFAFNFNNSYQLFQDDYVLQYDGTKSLALYDFKKDRLLQHNVLNDHAEVRIKMERKVKAIVQQYNNRMIENHLTVPSVPVTGNR